MMARMSKTRSPLRLFAPVLLAAALVQSGCVYADFKTTLDTDLNQTRLGDKTGESSTYSVLWLAAWGDSGTKAAAENGGLKQINHADTKVFSILWGLYTRYTTIVYGK